MVLQPTIIVQGGSSGIPAYDSLEEITSPTEGMVVKINGQEGEDRGVQAEDVLGVGIWAALPNTLTYSGENAVPITLLTFTDGTEIYTLYNELMEEPYTIDFAVYHGEQYANPIASLAFNEGYSPPASWNASSYNFGGRTVQAINDNSIQNAIKVQSPAIPDKYYIYKDSAWVELVDVSGTTAEEADVKDGEVFFKADGTQAEGTLVPLDVSDTTAVAADVAATKYFYTAAGVKTEGTATGSGGGYTYCDVTIDISESHTDVPDNIFICALFSNTIVNVSSIDYIDTATLTLSTYVYEPTYESGDKVLRFNLPTSETAWNFICLVCLEKEAFGNSTYSSPTTLPLYTPNYNRSSVSAITNTVSSVLSGQYYEIKITVSSVAYSATQFLSKPLSSHMDGYINHVFVKKADIGKPTISIDYND